MKITPSVVVIVILGLIAAAAAVFAFAPRTQLSSWSPSEVDTLRSLWIRSLPPLPADPSNKVIDEPLAVALGQKLFFDTRFSVNGKVACATCHVPNVKFTDGLARARGLGRGGRKTPTLIGVGYNQWFFWDGRRDSLWSQATGPLENKVEHGGTRTQYAHLITQYYRAQYEELFGPLPDFSNPKRFPNVAGPTENVSARAAWEKMAEADRTVVSRVYANLGKVLAAYERRLVPSPSRFDTYVRATLNNDTDTALGALSPDEVAGLGLFIGKAGCVKCHTGPLLTDGEFHNVGVPALPGLILDLGRINGIKDDLASEFNCDGPFSDAPQDSCTKIRRIKSDDETQIRAFKTPSLRSIAERSPYMHDGQFKTLSAVLEHYNRAPRAPAGQSEVKPLNLSNAELNQIEAFLVSLSSAVAVPPKYLKNPVENDIPGTGR